MYATVHRMCCVKMTRYNLTPCDLLCSVVVDLKVSNIVNLPNVTVSTFLPEDIFG